MAQRPARASRGIAVGDALEPVVEREREAADRIACVCSRAAPCASPCSTSGSGQMLESIGSSVNDTNSDTSTANATVTPNWKKILPIMPPMNATGMNTATTASDVDDHGEPDLVGAFLRGAVVVFPHLEVAHDVLAHHDGVVDQQADRERQRQQRHGVHREVEHPHDEERRDDARPAA